ncbi:MAG: tRNA 2-thiouridine(34) synthase MnmA [Burkholderiales bacterium]|nr:tRNA 2-thiouridine(34) synthase MnmA [Burkholderiales bacterium]
MNNKIVVGLSGGVDSAVSALLLKQQGFDVIGLFMKNWEDDDDDQYCSTRQDFIDAAAAADVIGIDFEAVNFAAEYKDRVFAEFLREYAAGRTPNPDVLCNAEIKFKAFLDHALKMGAAKIATGHYARVREVDGTFELLKGVDPGKDQSYFLHRLNQHQLSKSVFPVGHLHKTEVRRLASVAGLPNHAKKDSTGICFIGERPFRDFLQRYLPREPGEMVTPEGRSMGCHEGLMYYTIGQRQGLGIGGTKSDADGARITLAGIKSSEGDPWFVAGKNIERNELVVVQGHDHPRLLKRTLAAQDATWVSGQKPAKKTFGAKTRYRQADSSCELDSTTDGACETSFALRFVQAQWAITPGQSAVVYDGEICLGGGVISH